MAVRITLVFSFPSWKLHGPLPKLGMGTAGFPIRVWCPGGPSSRRRSRRSGGVCSPRLTGDKEMSARRQGRWVTVAISAVVMSACGGSSGGTSGDPSGGGEEPPPTLSVSEYLQGLPDWEE